MNLFQAIVLAIIEGLTEFLPVSSTGHMILGSSIMGIQSNNFVKLFTVAIQLGAILSVIVLYFKHFFQSVGFYFKLLVAFLPAVFFGLILSDKIDELLESPLGVAIALLIGGIILLFVDKWFKDGDIDNSNDISYGTALKIGLFQCLSMIPGTSRSAATIVGGMSQRLTRKAAAEFSFFLAIPTIFAATVYDLYKNINTLTFSNIEFILIGTLSAFLSAILVIKWFINFVSKNNFVPFGIYRIAAGIIILFFIAI